MTRPNLDAIEIPEAWGTLNSHGEPDAAAEAQLSTLARETLASLRRTANDERSARAELMAFFRGWERVCDENGSAGNSDVRECVYSVFEVLVNAAGFEGRARRWWAEACQGYLDVTVPELATRVVGMAARSGSTPDGLTHELERIVADVRAQLVPEDGEADIPGLGTFVRRPLGVSVRRWPASETLDPDEPPLPPVEESVRALLEDVRVNGPVHVAGLGIVGRKVLPAYEGRNPHTGQVIPVPEKSFFICLPDDDLGDPPEEIR